MGQLLDASTTLQFWSLLFPRPILPLFRFAGFGICQSMQVSGLVDGVPYAFFGHSLGALVAYETARTAEMDVEPV